MAGQCGKPFTFSVLALVVLSSLIATTASGAGSQPDSNAPTSAPADQINWGPISFETYANVTNYQDKLRFSKGHYKVVTRNIFGSANSPPLATHKLSILRELIRCENLTLARPDAAMRIGCHSLESYMTALELSPNFPSSTSSRNGLYALRLTAKLKSRYLWDDEHRRRRPVLVMYLLSQEYADRELLSLLGSSWSDEFSGLGLYIESAFHPDICNSFVYMALNETGLRITPLSNYQNLIQQSISDFLMSARNGLGFKIDEMSCSDSEGATLLKMNMHLRVVYQMQFPFLSLKHNFSFSPFPVWHYSGQVEQTRADQSDSSLSPEAYNTTVKMRSTSDFFNNLAFSVDQVFVNEKGRSGWELMDFIHSSLAARVESSWTPKSLTKLLSLWPTLSNYQQPDAGKSHPSVQLAFVNEPKTSEFVELRLKMHRSLFASLFPTAATSPAESGQPSDQSAHTEL